MWVPCTFSCSMWYLNVDNSPTPLWIIKCTFRNIELNLLAISTCFFLIKCVVLGITWRLELPGEQRCALLQEGRANPAKAHFEWGEGVFSRHTGLNGKTETKTQTSQEGRSEATRQSQKKPPTSPTILLANVCSLSKHHDDLAANIRHLNWIQRELSTMSSEPG